MKNQPQLLFHFNSSFIILIFKSLAVNDNDWKIKIINMETSQNFLKIINILKIFLTLYFNYKSNIFQVIIIKLAKYHETSKIFLEVLRLTVYVHCILA